MFIVLMFSLMVHIYVMFYFVHSIAYDLTIELGIKSFATGDVSLFNINKK